MKVTEGSMRVVRLGIVLLLTAALAGGCSMFGRDRGENGEPRDRLIVPPDLSEERIGQVPELRRQPGTSLTELAAGQDGRQDSPLLTEPPGMRVRRSGETRWLEVSAQPEQVWTWLNSFMADSGIPVLRESESLGVVETEWLARPIGLSGGVFMPVSADEEAPVREQYVFRLEPGGQRGRTAVYVAHRQAVADNGGWVPQRADRGRESEALRTFMTYVGVREAEATRQLATAPQDEFTRFETLDDGQLTLLVAEPFLQGWRRVGLALDRAGFTVEDRDRSSGRYLVRYDPAAEAERQRRGFFSRLAFWRDREEELEPGTYAYLVRSDAGSTRVAIATEEGDEVSDALAERLLTLVEEQLR
ncbi:MAG: outer membrane protein assembly factor BamC [Ectothiorhodospiraceae bacterium]|nr:outer membrane protein assembly factor BamC [Ectothiorhodospiraceae bacterium]